jgi:hypothetical protein
MPTIDGTLTLLSVAAHQGNDGLVVETWWRVDDGPVARPFSVMGHLLSASGDVVGMYDNLGVSPLALASGDILVQRHVFDVLPDSGTLWLRTGAYWLDSMERWGVTDRPGVDVLVVPIEVRD